MLGGHDGDRLPQQVVSLFQTPRAYGGKMFGDHLFAERPYVQPDVFQILFLHLRVNGGGDDVAGKKFVDEPFALAVQNKRAFAAHRFGDEKAPARLFRIKGGGVDLHVIQVLRSYPVFKCDRHRVARQQGEIRTVFVQSAHAARGEQHVIRIDGENF